LTWIYGIFRRERIACGLFTPMTWRRLSRRRRRMRSATRPASLAAVAPFHKKKQQYQQAGCRGNGAKGGSAATPAAVTGNAERKASGLCRFHWKYGEEDRICTKPCTWTGN
jgi:hypothetical protein